MSRVNTEEEVVLTIRVSAMYRLGEETWGIEHFISLSTQVSPNICKTQTCVGVMEYIHKVKKSRTIFYTCIYCISQISLFKFVEEFYELEEEKIKELG